MRGVFDLTPTAKGLMQPTYHQENEMRMDLNNVLQRSTSVRVEAHWEPIADSSFNLHNEYPEHAGLFDLSPIYHAKEYEADAFKVFLPSRPMSVSDLWELDSEGVVQFLRQFHPGATTKLHHGTEGAYACLRALSSKYAEITFRIHADFALSSIAYGNWRRDNSLKEDEGKARFIPSQFAGRLVVNLKEKTVRAFSLALPPRNSNVDINAYGGADMVFVPRMELVGANADDQCEIVWDTAITEDEARRALELKFYKFAEIEWRPVEEAVKLAVETGRPIHAILVWGALDDESC